MASPFLRQTGLPQISLAKIWELADQDKDGRLSSIEFVSAMALCDAAKSGQPIPEQLPAELGRGGGSSGLGGMATSNTPKPDGGRMGLEEERRKNMEKGMAELERRRELIRQREEAERQEAEKKRQAAEAEKVRLGCPRDFSKIVFPRFVVLIPKKGPRLFNWGPLSTVTYLKTIVL